MMADNPYRALDDEFDHEGEALIWDEGFAACAAAIVGWLRSDEAAPFVDTLDVADAVESRFVFDAKEKTAAPHADRPAHESGRPS